MLKHLPNALTLTRLILAPVIAWLMWQALLPPTALPEFAFQQNDYFFVRDIADVAQSLTLAAILFVVAALTDFFDGIAARAFNAHSKFGRLIDPIADKALVGLPLIVIALGIWQSGNASAPVIALATAVIVIRDMVMTAIRFVSPDGEGVRVSSLAKWKTALELVVVGSLLVVGAIGAQIQAQDPTTPFQPAYAESFEMGWIALLIVTAALSAYTAWQYLAPAKKS